MCDGVPGIWPGTESQDKTPYYILVTSTEIFFPSILSLEAWIAPLPLLGQMT